MPKGHATGTAASPLEFWSLRGRISVTHGEESWSGSLRWHHSETGDELTIRDPIGRSRLEASSLPLGDAENFAKVQIAGQPPITGSDLGSLLQSVSHLYVPFNQLSSWVVGQQSPAQTAEVTTDPQTGKISRIAQAGWIIDYPKHQMQDSIELPLKIVLHNDATQIRVIITQWRQLTR